MKGGKWHALFDKVFRELNLFDSARKVLKKKGAAGVDQQSVTDFAEHERDEIRSLHEESIGSSNVRSGLRDGALRG